MVVVFGSSHHLPILHESHRTVDSIYFRNHGLISVVIVNARTVEAGGLETKESLASKA